MDFDEDELGSLAMLEMVDPPQSSQESNIDEVRAIYVCHLKILPASFQRHEAEMARLWQG